MPEKFENPKSQEKAAEKSAQSAGLELETEVIKKELPTPKEKKSDVFVADVFDPEEELKKIKKLPREEKRQALEKYKEKLAGQKEGLAGMQAYFITLLRGNPGISFKEISEEVEGFGNKLNLTWLQRAITRATLVEYKTKHDKVREIRGKYPDDRKLYKNLFGKEPKGKVEVIEGSMTLYFRCYNLEDYALIHSQAFTNKRELKKEDLVAASMSGGVSIGAAPSPGLEGTIIAENVQKVDPNRWQQIYQHEEQHAIKRLFNDATVRRELSPGVYKFKDRKEQLEFSERYLRIWREDAEVSAKDEILAFLRSGDKPSVILGELTKPSEQGGIYDYFKDIREKKLPELLAAQRTEEDREIIRRAAENIFDVEYKKLIGEGTLSFRLLVRDLGYSKEKAISLLINEPLMAWPKAAVRMYAEHKEKR